MKTLTDLFNTFRDRKKTAFVYLTGIRRFVFSYTDLYDKSLRFASWLERQGVNKGDRVVIWAPSSPWWAIAFWGVVVRGGVIVPVDFASGKERAEKIAQLADAKFVIQSHYKLEKLDDTNSIFIEDLQYKILNVEPAKHIVSANETDVVELVYTSGTTGDPKGVILTHKNLISNLLQVNKHIPVITQGYNFLSLLPLSHMFEQMGGFLTPLFNGSSIVYIRTLKPSAIMKALKHEDIYAAIIVPRLLQALKNGIERELQNKGLGKIFVWLQDFAASKNIRFRKFLFAIIQHKFGKNFQLFVSGGSALDLPTAKFWQNLGFKVIEGYGLTECSPILAGNYFDEQRLGSVGKPLPNVKLKLLDGEILAKGDNIFGGYWQNEAATKQAFTDDGWFKTGDLGKVENDWWYIKGRKKDMVVTAEGINVYPEDVEAVLNNLVGVKESCVVGQKGGEGERVHAALILDGSGRKIEDVIAEANGRLDPQQQITSFSLWPELEFPKTTTLKIQKFKVLESLKHQATGGAGITSDRLVNLIGKITQRPVIEIKESSILVQDLGLTSVARLELVNYLEQEFRLDLEDTAINQKTTVAELRKIIEKRENTKTENHFHLWPNSPFGRGVRLIFNWLLNYPIFFGSVTLNKKGLENLDSVKEPVIFIANHISYYDHPAIVYSLPHKWRYNTATAAWEEFFFKDTGLKGAWKRFAYYYGMASLNLFPLPQDKGFRKTLEFMGKLVDHKVNILIFPEGERTWDGSMLPFMDGLGLIAKELQVPIVPVKIKGMEKVFPRGIAVPKRGKVEVIFGKPLIFTEETPSEILAKSKKAVEIL